MILECEMKKERAVHEEIAEIEHDMKLFDGPSDYLSIFKPLQLRKGLLQLLA